MKPRRKNPGGVNAGATPRKLVADAAPRNDWPGGWAALWGAIAYAGDTAPEIVRAVDYLCGARSIADRKAEGRPEPSYPWKRIYPGRFQGQWPAGLGRVRFACDIESSLVDLVVALGRWMAGATPEQLRALADAIHQRPPVRDAAGWWIPGPADPAMAVAAELADLVYTEYLQSGRRLRMDKNSLFSAIADIPAAVRLSVAARYGLDDATVRKAFNALGIRGTAGRPKESRS